mmetsp:Transcript_22154/g.32246  ORF Transcript_22154/g.32246 Transcript_22154/m.32246 type:complete len:136 (-) Transcript_22154:205-612(-)
MEKVVYSDLEYVVSSLENKSDSDIVEALSIFSFIVADTALLERAIGLVDNKGVTRVQNFSTSRHFWLVKGGETMYRVVHRYCPCRSFCDKFKILGREAVCKHLLAVMIARAMKSFRSTVLGNNEFVNTLLERQDL